MVVAVVVNYGVGAVTVVVVVGNCRNHDGIFKS